MTIKQLGGVFGRNPTFNDVTIEGELTFEGDIDVNSDLKVNGDLDVVGDITAGNQAFLKTVISEYSMEVGGQYGKMVGTKTGSGVGGLEFYSYSGGLYKTADLTNSGNLNLTTGNLIVSSGAGIDFSATAGTGTSELFDDYEEGIHETTLTPSVSGTITLSSSQNTLSYTKIGRMMHVTGYLQITGTSSPVGYIKISLPTAIGNVDDSGAATSGSITITGSTANVRDYICVGLETENFVRVYLGDATTIQSDSADALSGSDFVYLSFSYVSA